ncbi:35739_t:CDS:2, partial [Gigaspora margarita]
EDIPFLSYQQTNYSSLYDVEQFSDRKLMLLTENDPGLQLAFHNRTINPINSFRNLTKKNLAQVFPLSEELIMIMFFLKSNIQLGGIAQITTDNTPSIGFLETFLLNNTINWIKFCIPEKKMMRLTNNASQHGMRLKTKIEDFILISRAEYKKFQLVGLRIYLGVNPDNQKVKDGVKIVIDIGLTIARAFPAASNIVVSINSVIEKVNKNSSNKALCRFICDHLKQAKYILESSLNCAVIIEDVSAFTRYSDILTEVEKRIEILTGSNARIKAWAMTKKFMNAKELEQEFMSLYYRLIAANEELSLAIIKNTHKDVVEMKEDVKQIHNDIYLLAMNLGIEGWNTDIMLNSKISELDNQEQVIRGQAVKKKYLTQDVAQKPFNSDNKTVNMLKLLSNCENVIKFLGIYKSIGQEFMILEWCEHGNLEEYLLQNPGVDWKIKIEIAKGIANGLVFCHDREILHHDIKSSNILLDAHLRAKLSNFDLSRKKDDVTNSRIPSIDDVSLGIVLWVIAVQQTPYSDMESIGEIDEYVLNKNRPAIINEHIPNKYVQIMEKAWDHDSGNRMTVSQIYESLSKCLNDDDSSPILISNEPDLMNGKVENSDNTYDVKHNEIEVNDMYNMAVANHRKKNHCEAYKIFDLLANEYKHKESVFLLGYYYDNGYAIEPDKKKALEYYRDSADAGYNEAIFCYANNCLRIGREYMEKSARHRIFKSGIKLAEITLPELRNVPSQDTCDKLLTFLNNDKTALSGKRTKYPEKAEEWDACEKKIERLRDEIQQIAET